MILEHMTSDVKKSLRPAFLLPLLLFMSCEPSYNQDRPVFPDHTLHPSFGDYWYQGKAEITSYALEQVRYGEVRAGHAALIFVTEDFSRSKQVKLDDPAAAGRDAVKVMKLNFTKNFTTGIYPYSMMRSTFTPVYLRDDPYTIKVTTSSQEWCGHSFTQINLSGDKYQVRRYSYFETEGDSEEYLDNAILEDELWNLIRLAPDQLPSGSFKMITGTLYDRLSHSGIEIVDASGALEEGSDGISIYTVNIEQPRRSLKIGFRSDFPYAIEWWEETNPEGRPDSGTVMTTKAVRSGRIMVDYWTKNGTEHVHYRDSLNLP
jgi:hypothetical protein